MTEVGIAAAACQRTPKASVTSDIGGGCFVAGALLATTDVWPESVAYAMGHY